MTCSQLNELTSFFTTGIVSLRKTSDSSFRFKASCAVRKHMPIPSRFQNTTHSSLFFNPFSNPTSWKRQKRHHSLLRTADSQHVTCPPYKGRFGSLVVSEGLSIRPSDQHFFKNRSSDTLPPLPFRKHTLSHALHDTFLSNFPTKHLKPTRVARFPLFFNRTVLEAAHSQFSA